MPGPLTRAPQESTIGAAFLTQTVSVNDATVKFEIWCVALPSHSTPYAACAGTRLAKSATTASRPCTTEVMQRA